MRARPSYFGCDAAMVAGDDLLFCVFGDPEQNLWAWTPPQVPWVKCLVVWASFFALEFASERLVLRCARNSVFWKTRTEGVYWERIKHAYWELSMHIGCELRGHIGE